LEEYNNALSLYGADDEETKLCKQMLDYNQSVKEYTEQRISDQKFVDNTVYIFLVPDLSKRISST
jgi:hypothetical protein